MRLLSLILFLFVTSTFCYSKATNDEISIVNYDIKEYTIQNEVPIYINSELLKENFKIITKENHILYEFSKNDFTEYEKGIYRVLVSNCQIKVNNIDKSLNNVKQFIVKIDNDEILFHFNESKCHSKENIEDEKNDEKPKVVQIKEEPSISVNNYFKLGQNILTDAKFLMTKNKGEWPEERKKEVGSETFDKAKSKLLSDYRIDINHVPNNPFLKDIPFDKTDNSRENAFGNSSNITKTDVTNFATGMARFLADRAKQELNETFFIQMHKQMQKIPELQVYFPESYKFLKRLDANTMSFDLEYLKTRFELDIKFLPKHILVSIDEAYENKYPYFRTANQYLNHNVNGLWLNIGLHSVLNSNGNINPKDLLYQFVHAKQKEGDSSLLQKLEGKLKDYDDKSQINLINSIKLAELVSNSLLSPETGRYWVSQNEINELISNEGLFQTYIGLLLAKSDFDEYKIQFYGANDAKDYKDQSNNSLKSIIEDNFTKDGKVGDITDLKNLISDIYQTYQNVEEKVNGFKDIKNERELAEKSYDAFSLVKTSVSTIKDLVSNKSYLGKTNIKIDESVLTNYIDPTVEVAYNLFNKKYNIAIKNFIYILNQVPSVSKVISDYDLVNLVESVDFDDTRNLNRDKLMITFLKQKDVRQSIIESHILDEKKLEEIINKNYISKTDLENIVKSKEKDIIIFLDNNKDVQNYFKKRDKEQSNFLSKFNTYGTLIANVATAQNSDEVKAAIEASVLPVGSSRIKRNSNWSITANAFVGGFYGRAFYKQEVNGLLEKRSVDTFGITAPMGILFSKGNLKVFKQNSVLGINLQLIDLGSLVNFYMQEGDGASLPRDTKIQLGDIIAPGGSISYSIGDTPFTLLGGVQYVPNLSRMEVIPTNTDFKPLTWRMHIGVAIDIPLFNLKIWN